MPDDCRFRLPRRAGAAVLSLLLRHGAANPTCGPNMAGAGGRNRAGCKLFGRPRRMAKILLIDGSNYLFRAFHGLPDLRTSSGEPTGAMRGFFGMLGKVWSLVQPNHAAIVFDAHGKNFRHELYPAYKSNRPPMPDDLRVQIEPLEKMLADLGWPLISVPGVEADDVIATLAEAARAAGMKTVIATGDKDMAQLVDEDIVLINTMNTKFYDRDGVIEKYGVPPERIIDYLSLMGDKVDNVPGIEKCGPKTAAKWIAQYGSLDGVRAHADEVSGKIGENLRAGLAFLEDARRLVTIKRDCELPEGTTPAALVVRPASEEAVSQFCRRWEMSPATLRRAAPGGIALGAEPARENAGQASQGSLFGDEPSAESAPVSQAVRVTKAPGLPPAVVMPTDDLPSLAEPVDAVPFTEVTDLFSLEALAAHLASSPMTLPAGLSAVWDGEARRAALTGLGIALSPKDVWVIRTSAALPAEAVAAALRDWLESPAPKVMHDAKTFWHVMKSQGITMGGRLDDTMLMSYVLEAHLKHDLRLLAARALLRPIPDRESVFGRGAKAVATGEADHGAVLTLLAEEAAAVRALSSVLGMRLAADKALLKVYETLEAPLIEVLARMEDRGVAVDCFRLAQESEDLGRRIDELAAEATRLAGHPFNLSSPKQLGEVLFKELSLPVKKKTSSGAPSTDEEVLTELALDYPLPKVILEHRRLTKLRSTYLDKLPRMTDPRDGRVHTTFGQATAVTGRLASSDPNLQNIPVRTAEGRRVREAFVAESGNVIISADYSQIELRIMAHLSQDKGLLDAFARGEDIHRATAAEVFGRRTDEVTADERRMAKVINFGLIYGMSAFGLAQTLGVDRRIAAHYIDEYFLRYPGVKRYMEAKRAEAHERGYVETAFGRRLWIPEIASSRKPIQAAAERAAINAPMQGTAADLIKMAMIAVDAWIREEGLGTKLILQVHDELILEAPLSEVDAVKAAVPKLMADVASLSVPLTAEVGAGASWEEAH